MNASFFMDGVRNLFGLIDSGIYNLISIVYELIIKLSNITFFSEANIREVRDRIYVFLAVFMLFKVTISLITYLVDPDSMGDKTNGIGNVAKNVVITLFLIIIVPFGFDLLYEAQNAIISDNLIPRVILGTKGDGSNVNESYTMDSNACKDGDTFVTTTINSDGDLMAYLAFRPFYQTYKDADISSIKNDYCSANSVSNLLTSDIYNAESGTHNSGQYLINYQILLSTACGILVFLLLLNFAFDIAARTIKLGFLEIIAPIPILSYIDPKSAKDGPFKKWLSEVGKTWASLFIRLAIVYFAIYAIKLIPAALEQANDENGIWVSLFLLIGILIFAKNAIPLIENLFGIKFDHTVQLNPFKKISEQALGGKALVSAPGKMLAAGIGGGVALGGAIAGNLGKTKALREAKSNLKPEERKLQELQNKARMDHENYISALRHYKKNPSSISEANMKRTKEIAERSRDAARTQIANVKPLREAVNTEQAKYDKATTDNEGNRYFSAARPVASSILQSLRGAKLGFNEKETANIAKSVAAGLNAAKTAAKQTNDFDKFGYMDRLRDLQTDITGVKNESGTTSIVKKEMKEQIEYLNDIKNAISSLEHSFGNLKPGMVTYDANGKMMINNNYNYAPGEKEGVQGLINDYETLRGSEKKVSKQIKEYESVLAINKPSK